MRKDVSGHRDLRYPWEGVAPDDEASADLNRETEQWLMAGRLLRDHVTARRFNTINVGLLTTLAFPGAPREKQILIAEFLAWIFIQDDRYDEAVSMQSPTRLQDIFNTYMQVLRGKPAYAYSTPSVDTLQEIVDRIRELSTPSWMARFENRMRQFWFNGIIAEAEFRRAGVVPDVPDYMTMRAHAIGVLPFLCLVEIAHDCILPSEIIADPTLNQMSLLTARIVAYVNDIFSFRKERDAGDPNNIVHILMYHRNLSFTDAVDHTVRIHDREFAEFSSLERLLPPWAPGVAPRVARYVEGHKDWMKGALEWQRVSERYLSGRNYLDDPTTDGFNLL